jgi:hypothetical protein
MPDLSQAHAVLRGLSSRMSPITAATGTDRGNDSTLILKKVPTVPRVPSQIGSRKAACLCDVLERAAILEFCAGLPRKEADALALAEFGIPTWESLALSPTVSD